jgi:hypothetical protein
MCSGDMQEVKQVTKYGCLLATLQKGPLTFPPSRFPNANDDILGRQEYLKPSRIMYNVSCELCAKCLWLTVDCLIDKKSEFSFA